jgi:hypothetical protein
MILKYQKITDNYTTYTLLEPDYQEEDLKCVELCTIGNYTYVFVPEGTVLPDQPEQIIIEEITLTKELREEIKLASPHVQLSYKRLNERIRSKYSLDDEQYFSRISIGALTGSYEMQEDEPVLIQEYQTWVEECREIARQERASWGLA